MSDDTGYHVEDDVIVSPTGRTGYTIQGNFILGQRLRSEELELVSAVEFGEQRLLIFRGGSDTGFYIVDGSIYGAGSASSIFSSL